MISFECPSCRKKLQVKDEFAGREGKCPLCGSTMSIPRASVPEEAPLPARPVGQALETTPDDFDVGSAAPAESPRRSRDDDEGREPRRERGERRTEKPRKSKSARKTSYDENEAYSPPEEMTNHGGGEIHPRDDFFASPPEEIGEVVSAYTTLRQDVEPMAPGTRLAGALMAGAAGLVLGIVIAVNIKSVFFQLFLPLLLGGLGLGIVLLCTGFKHTCTYVGKEGVARYTCRGNRDTVSEELFCFEEASDLKTQQTRHYTNGVYQGTHYVFTWTDVGGRTRFTIQGQHKTENGNPPAKHPFHFGSAAEQAWTIYLLGQVSAQLQTQGTIYFGLGGKNWVKLSEGHIAVHMNGQTTDCDAEDIAEVRIEAGMVEVRRNDAKQGWFSSKGIFRFPYGTLSNAHLFLILMDKLVGVRIN